ncbi:MAG: PKD domain-containing protein [Chitinophagaceae bacterium]|nr:PKD domain-containing protein [Chitinophagaceae bacterium]
MILLCTVILLCISNAVFAQPAANFSAVPTSGCAPLVVQFSDNSSGYPTSWNWDLGNGTLSSQKNPVTTYPSPGTYTVKLTASNSSGSNTISKTQYITVYDKPLVKFTVNDSANCIPFVTKFTDLSTSSAGTNTTWQWDFDDGTISSLQNPQHLYNLPGNYNITLKVTNSGGCFSSLSKLAYIKAADSIRTLFNFSQPIKCKPPETIRFTNSTLGPGTLSYNWNFGDGGTSTQTSVSHTYISSGLYTITLVVANNSGCRDTLVYKDTWQSKIFRLLSTARTPFVSITGSHSAMPRFRYR